MSLSSSFCFRNSKCKERVFVCLFVFKVEEYFTVRVCNRLNMTADIFWHQVQVHIEWLMTDWLKWNHKVEWHLLFSKKHPMFTCIYSFSGIKHSGYGCTHAQNTWEELYQRHNQSHRLYHITGWEAFLLELAAHIHTCTKAKCMQRTNPGALTCIQPVISLLCWLISGIFPQIALVTWRTCWWNYWPVGLPTGQVQWR